MIRIRTLEGVPQPAQERIIGLLDAHATDAGHPFRSEQLVFEAWDDGAYAGGLQARFGVDWVFVELLAVAETARGKGVGRKLMRAVEDAAREKGMIGIWLDTYSFQAPGFYRRLGYVEFGRIKDYPKGEERIFFSKRVDGGE